MSHPPDDLREHRALIDACLHRRIPFFWQSPGTLLISGSGVADVVELVEAGGYRVLGFEGFELEGPSVRPRIDLIVDFAISGDRGRPADAIADWPDDVWVDVTLREPDDA